MTDYEALAADAADLWVVLFVTDLALGIGLERTGLLPSAVDLAVALGGILCVLAGVTGLVLVVLGRGGGDRRAERRDRESLEGRP